MCCEMARGGLLLLARTDASWIGCRGSRDESRVARACPGGRWEAVGVLRCRGVEGNAGGPEN